MPIVITVQTNFIRIDYVIVIPHRQFLIRHFVNLHLQKTSALSLHTSALVSDLRRQTSYIRHLSAFSLHTSALVSALRRQTSYIQHLSAFSLHTSALRHQPSFRHHTSSLSPSSRQSAKGQRDEQRGGSGNPDNTHAPRHRTLIAASNPSPPD